jgi:hypothetical protein
VLEGGSGVGGRLEADAAREVQLNSDAVGDDAVSVLEARELHAEVRVQVGEEVVQPHVLGLHVQVQRVLLLVVMVVLLLLFSHRLVLIGGLASGAEQHGLDGRRSDGRDGDADVAARQRVGLVDVGVAGGAEHGRVRLAGHGGGRHLAHLAHAHALVPRVRGPRVARRAEERAAAGAAVHRRRRRLARAAPPASHAPVLVKFHRLLVHRRRRRGGLNTTVGEAS